MAWWGIQMVILADLCLDHSQFRRFRNSLEIANPLTRICSRKQHKALYVIFILNENTRRTTGHHVWK